MSYLAVDYITPEFAAFLATYIQAEIDRGCSVTRDTILNAYIQWTYQEEPCSMN
jgi:hypothetical protein